MSAAVSWEHRERCPGINYKQAARFAGMAEPLQGTACCSHVWYCARERVLELRKRHTGAMNQTGSCDGGEALGWPPASGRSWGVERTGQKKTNMTNGSWMRGTFIWIYRNVGSSSSAALPASLAWHWSCCSQSRIPLLFGRKDRERTWPAFWR